MSDSKPSTGLALPGNSNPLSRENVKAWRKKLRAESDTDAAELERRRMLLAEKALMLEPISQLCMAGLDVKVDPNNPPSSDSLYRLTTAATLLGMQGMLDGLGLLVDCLTTREKVEMEGGKVGFFRFSCAQHAAELNEALWGVPPDPDGETEEEREGEAGLVDLMETGLAMLEEIGDHQKAFKSNLGTYLPGKYSNRSPEQQTGPKKTYGANEAVSQDELDQGKNISAQEAIEKLKKGKTK